MDAVTLVTNRLMGEEAFRAFPYDDATGLLVKAPKGNITIGFGSNISAGWSRGRATNDLRYTLSEIVPTLNALAWYDQADPVRQSVFLDVAYNDGTTGLLGFEKMIEAAKVQDWKTAAAELLDSAAARKLESRYTVLADILRSGRA